MTRASPTHRRVRRHLPILLILILAAALRVYRIGDDSLSGDEVLSLTLAKMDIVNLVKWDTIWEQIPPAHHLLLHFWIKLFGTSEISMRLPSAIAGVAAVWMTWILAGRLLGGRAALMTAALMAVSPMQIAYAQECRAYALSVFLGALSCDLFMRLLRRPTQRRRLWFIVVTALLMYTHLYGAFMMLAQQIAYAYHCLRGRRKRTAIPLSLRAWVVNNLVVVALFGAWIPVALAWTKQVNVAFWVKKVTFDDITRAYWTFSGSTPVFVAMVALIVLAIARWRRQLQRIALPLAVMLVPIVIPVTI
jgi:mannosyltransferase